MIVNLQGTFRLLLVTSGIDITEHRHRKFKFQADLMCSSVGLFHFQ